MPISSFVTGLLAKTKQSHKIMEIIESEDYVDGICFFS